MIAVVTAEEAQARRKPLMVPGFTDNAGEGSYYITRILGALTDNVNPADPAPEEAKSQPQAYHIEQPPQATVRPHYHDTNQFQVFLKGRAVFGAEPVVALSVHYASAHTPYGPIVTENVGSHYVTLRNRWDSGGKTMPESRATLRSIPRRFRMAEDIPVPDGATLAPGQARRQDALECEADGLGIAVFALGPGAGSDLALAIAGAGRFALVLAGSVDVAGEHLEAHGCLYIGAVDAPHVIAASDGASVLVTQFPPEPD
jgi:hypothetical protein